MNGYDANNGDVIDFNQRHWQSLSPFAPAFLDSLDFRFTKPGWLP
jgi:hypothetical protein